MGNEKNTNVHESINNTPISYNFEKSMNAFPRPKQNPVPKVQISQQQQIKQPQQNNTGSGKK